MAFMLIFIGMLGMLLDYSVWQVVGLQVSFLLMHGAVSGFNAWHLYRSAKRDLGRG